jgi:hypothetical protein
MKRMIAFALLAVLCISCSPPPFDLDLLRTAYIAGKMTKEAAVGTSLPMDQSTGWEAVFMPTVIQNGATAGVDCTRGFVRVGNQDVSAVLFAYPELGEYQSFGEGQYIWTPTADPSRVGARIMPLKTGYSLGGFVIDPNDTSKSVAFVFFADVTTRQFSGLLGWQLTSYLGTLGVLGTDRVLGIAVPPSPDPLFDTCFFLTNRSSAPPVKYIEASAMLDRNGLAIPSIYRPINDGELPFLDGVPRCQYFHDAASGTSIACIRSDKRWRTFTWPPAYKEMPNISARIDALLSTGELFSTEDGIARVFSMEGNGSELASFPLHNLTYSGEAFSNGVARMYFTQSFVTEYRLRFYVFSIPTTDLKNLDEP